MSERGADGTTTAVIISMAAAIQKATDEVLPDQHPMTLRAALLLAADAYLQKATLDKVVNDVYRRPSNK